MEKKITTFMESDNPLIKQDLKEFGSAKYIGQSENVKVTISRNDAYVFTVENEDETYFFGLKGETLDNMARAVNDLIRKIAESKASGVDDE